MRWLRQHRIEVTYALVGAALIAGVVALDRLGVMAALAGALEPAMEALAGAGLLGAFVLGLVGNSSLLLQVPYTLPMLSAALVGAPTPYLIGLAVAAGLGATLGELVSYGIAAAIMRRQHDLPSSELYRWVHRTVRTHPRATPWLVFAFAVTVLPDDAVLIPLATVRYGARRLILPLAAGKLGYCLAMAAVFDLLGDQAGRWASREVAADLGVIALIVFLLVVFAQMSKARARRRADGSVGRNGWRDDNGAASSGVSGGLPRGEHH